jgi:sugar lactone lactonase YvrE
MIDRRGFAFRAHMSATGYQLLGAPLYIGPGRPLGFHLQDEDELYVCDSLKGLLRVQLSSGAIEVLANAVKASDGGEPQPINYANDLDIGSDGSVYFTWCTDGPVARNTLGFYDTMFSYMLSALRGAADGRLLRWDPATRKTTVLVDGFSYANGVALSADESWLAVVETNLARVHRHWLRGPRSGEMEVLLAGLPGFPDGVSRSPDGGFWVGLVAPLSPWGAIVKLNAEGEPSHALYNLDGNRVSSIAFQEHEGRSSSATWAATT